MVVLSLIILMVTICHYGVYIYIYYLYTELIFGYFKFGPERMMAGPSPHDTCSAWGLPSCSWRGARAGVRSVRRPSVPRASRSLIADSFKHVGVLTVICGRLEALGISWTSKLSIQNKDTYGLYIGIQALLEDFVLEVLWALKVSHQIP